MFVPVNGHRQNKNNVDFTTNYIRTHLTFIFQDAKQWNCLNSRIFTRTFTPDMAIRT